MYTRSLLSAGLVIIGLLQAQPAEWTPLFDGSTLEGWKASENPASFKVEDRAIVAHGPRAHLFYTGPELRDGFKNFDLSVEVNAEPGANSGIYFHTQYQETGWPSRGFEIQINNSATQHGDYLEMKKTGSLYGLRNVYKQLIPDSTWFTMQILVQDRNVEIRVNGTLLVDYFEPMDAPDAGPRRGKRLDRGTFALQGHDPESRVAFRNLRVKRLPDDIEKRTPVTVDGFYLQVLQLGSANYPLVDFHTHLKGGLTMDEILTHGRQVGFSYGIAVNCGLGFSITNDAGIHAFLQEYSGAPVFLGMQAEGREWVKLFSPRAVARFDYVFTDAMTISDHRGKRTRLWIPDEVEIPDKQAFMERLVAAIERIVSTEPIDIYVNPTFLPDVIAADYDFLWTPERRQRVIAACAKHGVALEINSRYQIPKSNFIREAKKAGLKFTLGTNNPGRDIVENTYGLAMIRDCGLNWQDMWMPKPDGQKRIQQRLKN